MDDPHRMSAVSTSQCRWRLTHHFVKPVQRKDLYFVFCLLVTFKGENKTSRCSLQLYALISKFKKLCYDRKGRLEVKWQIPVYEAVEVLNVSAWATSNDVHLNEESKI